MTSRAQSSDVQGPSSDEAADNQGRAALIARRAYEKWQARGCPEGDDRRDWYEAEQEIFARPPQAVEENAGSRPRARNRGATS
jgi:hypothetical protein